MPSTHETKFLLTAKDNTKGVFRGFKGQLKDIGVASAQLAGAVVGLAGAAGFGLLGNGLIDTNIQFQNIKSSLKTLEGSSEGAQKTFDRIVEFATTTPFNLTQVTDAFVKLKALGLDPSEEAITSYGNTAAAMGKSLNQMIEAVADASTMEFERLKEFGITAKKNGEEIEFTFQGVTTTVGRNAAEVTAYLQSIGNTKFAGAMTDQMQNVGAAFDNFGTAIKLIQTKIGEGGLNDAIANTTNTLTEFINSIDKMVISEATLSSLEAFQSTLEGIDSLTGGIGKAFQFLALGGTEAEFLKKGVTGGSADYQLGDFNRARGNDVSLKEALRLLQERQGKNPQLDEQTGLLKSIADGIGDAVTKNQAVAQ